VKPSLVVRNMLNGFFDFLYLSRVSDDRFRSLVEVSGEEHLIEALSRGKGLLAITAHYSAWELIPRAVVLMGARVGVVGRKLWNPGVSRILDGIRSRHGVQLIDRSSSASGLVRLLRSNTAVGILIDQDTKKVESRFIPFLGLEAETPVGPSGIALRKGVPILTLHIAGKGKRRYLLTIDPPVETAAMEERNGIDELTGLLNERIGEWIRRDPNQWVWFHDRWNRRPSASFSGLQ
jgi:Kdo2-lipid IVA lauroyltransferase/acyltransferase